jgi:S-adenosyl methyltransferase
VTCTDIHYSGKDNYAADRQAVRQLLTAAPEVRDSARANRAFLQRAVRFLAGEARIRQIIDVGTGIPAAGNVHEVAAQVAAGTQVAYVDNDRCKLGCAHSFGRTTADRRAQR